MPETKTEFIAAKDRPIVRIRRVFHAPRHKVWEALTKPEYIERWYGPRRYRTEVPELDLRVGGQWRFLNIDANGSVFGFHGQYQEIVPDERLVYTWVYEGEPDQVVIETGELEERDGTTTLDASAEYPDFASRDANMQAGMTEGASESYARLDEVLATME